MKGGPHEISFVEEPLVSSGIFAIVGPTGSGKSTILDVITLALFNEVPRHGKLSKNAILDAGSIVTHNTKNAFASVEYEVKGQIFTSSWSIDSTRNGNLKDYDMNISDVHGNFLDLRRSEVPSKNMELIGLNYDQFVKSIILSQGDFSKFLKARKEERSELLERLTGSEIYRKISMEAFRKNKEVALLLENEKSLLSEINLLTVEEVSQIGEEKQSCKTRIAALDVDLKLLADSKNIKDNIKRLKTNIAVKEQAVKRNYKERVAFKSESDRLAMHDKLKVNEGLLANYDQVRTSIDELKLELAKYEEDKTSAENDLNASLAELSELTQNQIGIHNFADAISAFEKAVSDLDNKLENCQVKGREIRSRLKNQIATKSFDFNVDVNPARGVKMLEDRIAEIKLVLNGSQVGLEVLKLTAKRKRENLSVLRDLTHILHNLEQHIKEEEKIKADLHTGEEKISITEPLLIKQVQLIDSVKSERRLLQKQKEDAIKIARLEHLRNQLVVGEPCPLCGSLDHPYHEHLKEPILSEIDSAIDKNGIEITEHQAQLEKYQHILSQATTAIELGRNRLEDLRQRLAKDKRDLLAKKDQFLGDLPDKDDDLKDYATTLQNELEASERQIEAIENLQITYGLLEIFRELEEVASAFNKHKSAREKLYKGSDIQQKSTSLKNSFVQSQTTIRKLEEIIETKRKDLGHIEERFKSLLHQLNKVVQELELESINHMKASILSHEVALELADKVIRLNSERIQYEAECNQLTKELEDALKEDKQREVKIEDLLKALHEKQKLRDELNASIGELTSKLKFDQENRKAQGERQKKISALEKDLEKWSLLNKMIGSAKGDSFANFAQELTLRNLLAYANRRLRDLTDRYLLAMPKDGGALGVIDLYQGNTERSVTTLSGGEIFILSLALALSLSDMASQNIALESLFIDEGFGTLDQETLDIAMTTLEKLQSESKKTVGIISHVEALKERINVQIRLQKNAQGFSKIKIVSS